VSPSVMSCQRVVRWFGLFIEKKAKGWSVDGNCNIICIVLPMPLCTSPENTI